MGNKPKTQPQNERRAKVEALKRRQKAAERKKTMTIIAGATVVAGAMIAVPTVKIISDKSEQAVAVSSIGVGAAGAQCSDVKVDKTKGSGDHVEGKVTYTTIPPTSGSHFVSPVAVNARGFYTEKDVPPLEELVHNLEHGYTILWYLPSLGQVGIDEIKSIAENMREDTKYRKFIAVPWNTDERGSFPNGKRMALSHWGAKEGFRQYCGIVSGEVVQKFVDEHPATDTPEPGSA